MGVVEAGRSSARTVGSGLQLTDIGFSFTEGATVLAGVFLDAAPGELVALLGPSGCGKTTLLRVIAGLETPSRGSVRLGGRVLTDVSTGAAVAPQNRGVAMVFQNWALFPHLDVAHNITFGMPKELRSDGRLLAETLAMVGLDGMEARRPAELSGGQQQRVALGRALAQRPDVLLLDEPFSNLDPALRSRVRAEVRELLGSLGTTTVLVTHDREEALLLGDRVALLADRTVVAEGDPVDLYRRPPDRFTARFLGDVVTLDGVATGGRVNTALGVLRCAEEVEGSVEVMLRPEQIRIARTDGPPGPGDGSGIPGNGPEGVLATVDDVAFHGPITDYTVSITDMRVGEVQLGVRTVGTPIAAVGCGVLLFGPVEPVVTWPLTEGG